MWSRIIAWVKSNFPLFILLVALGVVTWRNYPWNISLLGWDSVQPELDFGINLKRALTSVWVGNQGVGHIGGHGYATILIQGMIEWVISLVVDVAQTRGVFIFSMLWLGPIGIYYLWKKWFGNTAKFASWGAMLSGLFYLLNLGTVQVFYAPLEAFVVFYGLLPWAILSVVCYLQKPNTLNLIRLFVTQIIFSMIGFIPPQLVAYGMILVALMIGHILEQRRNLWQAVGSVFVGGLMVLIANLYWLLPIGYYSIHGASSYVEAKNNQVSTPDFQYMSEARGKWSDVALMRGFFIDSFDSVIKGEGKFFEIFEPWNKYLQGKVVWTGYGLFVVAMFGLLMMIVRKGRKPIGLAIILILVAGLAAIAQAEEPFMTMASFMHNIPIVGQTFRAAFTKFVGLLIFVYSIGFGYGIWILYKLFREKLVGGMVIVAIGAGSLIIYMWPMFNGNLIYERMKISMPSEYGQVMKFFKSEDKQARVAYLPSAWMWGWQVHEWGYSGSGFLWYGIEQPILDRAFDVWSPYNESFYNEFSTALYSCNPVRSDLVGFDKDLRPTRSDLGCNGQVAKVLDKYDVRYVLLDESVIAPGQGREILQIEETKRLAEELGWEQKFKEGFLTMWEIGSSSGKDSPSALQAGPSRDCISGIPVKDCPWGGGQGDKFISAPGRYTWVNADTSKVRKDVVYGELGTYVESQSSDHSPNASLPAGRQGSELEGQGTLVYPFAGLMREEIGDYVSFSGSDPVSLTVRLNTPPGRGLLSGSDPGEQEQGRELVVPGWKVEEIVRIEYQGGKPLPAYRVNGQDGPIFLGEEKPEEGKNIIYARISEGEEWMEYTQDSRFQMLGDSALQGQALKVEVPGVPQIYDFGKMGQGSLGNCDVLKRGTASKSQLIGSDPVSPDARLNTPPGRGLLSGSDPGEQGTSYVADSRGAACDYVVMGELDTRVPHLMRVRGENREGRSLKFFLYNTGSKRNDVEWLTQPSGPGPEGVFDQTFSLLPWSWDAYYTLNIETRSFGQRAENLAQPVEVRWFPLAQIAGARIESQSSDHSPNASLPAGRQGSELGLRVTEVKKTGTWLYKVKVEGSGLLRLSQGYDEGWIAMAMPASNLQKLNHVKVDGWANGWIVGEPATANGVQQEQILIFYWPQLLQYLGLVMLGVMGLWSIVSYLE